MILYIVIVLCFSVTLHYFDSVRAHKIDRVKKVVMMPEISLDNLFRNWYRK